MHDVKVRVGSVDISDHKHKIFHVEHHGGFKNIFQELVVLSRPPCLNFNDDSAVVAQCVGKERLVNVVVLPEKHGNVDFVVLALPCFDRIAVFLKEWADFCQDRV